MRVLTKQKWGARCWIARVEKQTPSRISHANVWNGNRIRAQPQRGQAMPNQRGWTVAVAKPCSVGTEGAQYQFRDETVRRGANQPETSVPDRVRASRHSSLHRP